MKRWVLGCSSEVEYKSPRVWFQFHLPTRAKEGENKTKQKTQNISPAVSEVKAGGSGVPGHLQLERSCHRESKQTEVFLRQGFSA